VQDEGDLRHDPEEGNPPASGHRPVGCPVGGPRDVQCSLAQSETTGDQQSKDEDPAARTTAGSTALLAAPQRHAEAVERGWEWRYEWWLRNGFPIARLPAARTGYFQELIAIVYSRRIK